MKKNDLEGNVFRNSRLRNFSLKNIPLIAFVLLFCASLSCVFLYSAISYAANVEKIKEQFLKKFPRTQNIDEINESPIKGVYEIVTPQTIYYYYPEKDLMIFGEIWDSTGKSLTMEKKTEITTKKIQKLPLDKAIKIGNGKNTVVEFIDPECPHCKTVYNYLKDKDVTIYAFVVPLFGSKSEKKIKYLLCAADKTSAYHEIMSQQDVGSPEKCNISDEQLNRELSELKQFLPNFGISGVPFLVVNGKPVYGANIDLVNNLLKKF